MFGEVDDYQIPIVFIDVWKFPYMGDAAHPFTNSSTH